LVVVDDCGGREAEAGNDARAIRITVNGDNGLLNDYGEGLIIL